jgi:hypothetical protein
MISARPRYLVQASLTPESGVHRDTSNHGVSSWGLQLVSDLLSCLPVWVQLLVRECRNLPCRIRAEQCIRSGFSPGSPVLPKELECFAVSGPSSHRHAYIRDMRSLRAAFPFLTYLDECVATLAWKAGTQTSNHTVCTESDRSTYGTTPEGGNPTPASATQQPTQRDPLNPFPSRA